ncbi:unnamed protein product [Parnassius mnemosyne]|uniref:Uncharacterized protein n=1 Tax=Parnassius mnemosyne TaxID=213953 RepID=A0AAV1KH11_9NEOP
MSNDNQGNPYKQRFKGIENFLRRVAFNLGNTPSQTEVKIISCIPIDVTDLQQRIITLERELVEAKTLASYKANTIMSSSITKNTPTRHSTPIIQTALGKPTPICSKSKNPPPCQSSQTNVPVTNHGCNTKSSPKRKSSVCFVSPNASNEVCTNKYEVTYAESNVNVMKASVNRDKTKVASKIVPKRLRRALRKKTKQKTQLVYFAQTSNTPFNSYDMTSESINKIAAANKKSVISRTYLNNMIRKQYEPEVIADELTDISQFSSPICRDIDPKSSNYNSHESNLSCYYKKFENLDKCLPRKNHNLNITLKNNLVVDPGPVSLYYQQKHRNNHDGYYDSDHYDIFPVKEKSVKTKKEILSKQFQRMHIEYWPENLRTKNNVQPVSYDNANKTCDNYDNIYKDDEEKFTISNAKRKKGRINGEREMNSYEPKICSVDYGNVYVKKNLTNDNTQKSNPTTPCLKNTECLTVNMINTQCQTVESKAIQHHIPNDNKAEVTLNQIKGILQSVLTEVKTNIKSNKVVHKPKKDVVIQKDVSHNNIVGGSTFLNSFTYNPSYSINPCLASYSRPVPNFCYANLPSLPMKCLPNYPLILPAKGQNCGCQHRGGDHKVESQIQTKPAATAATNTDGGPDKMQKNEAINLIKEIYKSVAVDINYSNENTSRISFGYQQKTEQPEVQSVNTKEVTRTEPQSAGQKNIQLLTNNIPTTILTSTITDNNTESIAESSQSEVKSELATTATGASSQITDNNTEEDKVYHTSDQVENETADQQSNNEETNTSGSETESGDTLVADEETKKKVKPGLFQKVLQTVNIFKKRKPEKMVDESESEESGSDYQTIYSYKTYKDLKQPITRTFQQPATKQRHLKPIVQPDREIRKDVQENRRRSPYMEQEYRRYWDEKLMFHENQSPVHSSERSFPGLSRSPQSPVFWRGYEARSAIIRHRPTKIHREHSKTSQRFQKERTGLKLEWLKKQKFKTPVSEES